MTSVRHKTENVPGGPYSFKIHGTLSYCAGSLLPIPNKSPVFAQVYIYDPDETLAYRMNKKSNAGLDRTMNLSAMGLTRNMPSEHQCRIAFQYLPGTDRHRYNLPIISNKIDAVVPGTEEHQLLMLKILILPLLRHGSPFVPLLIQCTSYD